MNGTTVTTFGLFLEGLLSFFTPCVLPLVPLYIGYLTSGRDENDPHHRRDTFILTLFFVLGICTVFLIMGLGSSALSVFFRRHSLQFQLFGGVLLIILGLMSLEVIHIPLLEKDYRIPGIKPGKSSPLQAFLLGFFFSFAWSPCIGPLLASAILAASSAPSPMVGIAYLAAYAAGFVIPFLIIGLFTDTALDWLKKHKQIVKYTGKLGGAVVAGMGIYMVIQANQEILGLQRQKESTVLSEAASQPASEAAAEAAASTETEEPESDEIDAVKYDFVLKDASGQEHRLSDHVGRPTLMSFYGTWCYYCNEELPNLQKIHENGDVDVILIAAPGYNNEGDIEYVEQYMAERGYTMQILYDTDQSVTGKYGVTGYPTTFALKKDGNFLGYMPGYMAEDVMEEVVQELTAS